MQLYHPGRLALSDLIARFTTGPARLLNLAGRGSLKPGAHGDVTVFDPDCVWEFRREDTASKSRNSPFYGWPLRGKALATIVGGCIVWHDETHGTPAPGHPPTVTSSILKKKKRP
jgi:dihydroorotase